MGSYDGLGDSQDWALIRLDKVPGKKPLGKVFGYLRPYSFDSIAEMYAASKSGKIMTAGFPLVKDPKFLWGETGVKISAGDPSVIAAAGSSGMSGGAVVWEYRPGEFALIGLIRAPEFREGQEKINEGNFVFSSRHTRIVNFINPEFLSEFNPAYAQAGDESRGLATNR